MMVFKVCVHVKYEDVKKEFFNEYPELRTDRNIDRLDSYVYDGLNNTSEIAILIDMKPASSISEIWKMFITWLKSKNILLNKEKEIYLDV